MDNNSNGFMDEINTEFQTFHPNHPFASDDPESEETQRCCRRRHELTKKFIWNSSHLPIRKRIGYSVPRRQFLDVGDANPITEWLGKTFKADVCNTCVDLDSPQLWHYKPSKSDWDYEQYNFHLFDAIFCFEIIEHLMNPLLFLKGCAERLKSDGVLFLSTPAPKPHFLWYEKHFHEFHPRELNILLDCAGFKVMRREKHSRFSFWQHFTGFRPLTIRWFWAHNIYLELQLKSV